MSEAKIGVGLFLNSSQFASGLKGIKSQLGHFKEGLSTLGVGLGFEELIRSSIEAGTQTYEMAKRFGLTTDTVQKLRFVASQTGTSLDTLSSGFGKLIKNGVAATGGSKEMQDAFARLGLSVADIQGLSVDQQFLKISDAVKDAKNPSQAYADVLKVMGKSAGELIPLLKEGSGEISDMFGNAPVVPEGGIEALHSMHQEIETLKLDFQVLGAAIVFPIALLDDFGKQLESVVEFILSADVAILSFFKNLASGLGVKRSFHELTEDMHVAGDTMTNQMSHSFDNILGKGEHEHKTGEVDNEAMAAQQKDAAELASTQAELGRLAQQYHDLTTDSVTKMRELREEMSRLVAEEKTAPDNTNAKAELQKQILKDQIELTKLEKGQADDRKKEQADADASEKRLGDTLRKNMMAQMTDTEKIVQLNQEIEDIYEQLKDVGVDDKKTRMDMLNEIAEKQGEINGLSKKGGEKSEIFSDTYSKIGLFVGGGSEAVNHARTTAEKLTKLVEMAQQGLKVKLADEAALVS